MIHRQSLLIAIVAITLLLPAASSAQQFTYSIETRPQFTLEIPEGWTLQLRKPSDPKRPRLAALAPADDLWVGTWALEKVEDFEQAKAYTSEFLEGLITSAETTQDWKEETYNGMPARHMAGKGKEIVEEGEGEPVEFKVAFFEFGPGRVGVVLVIGAPEASTSHKAELEALISSLRPVKS